MRAMKEENGQGTKKKPDRRRCLTLPAQGRPLSRETFALRHEKGERVCVSGEGDTLARLENNLGSSWAEGGQWSSEFKSKKQVANGGAGGRQGCHRAARFHPQSLCNLWRWNWKVEKRKCHSNILAFDNLMNRGALSAIVHGVARANMTECMRVCTHTHTSQRKSEIRVHGKKSDISLSEPPAALTWRSWKPSHPSAVHS